jgi:putative membrane protein
MNLSTATTHIQVAFGRNRLLHVLLGGYGIGWTAAAVAPADRADWLLENLLVISLLAALAGTYRVLPLSDVSYLCITAFLTLHTVGAHYTYPEVPIGEWAREAFGWSRNHYDRLVHFGFGLFMAYPIRELFLRVASARGFWAYYLPLDMTIALSAVYELVEWAAASGMPPALAAAYLGAQGDSWDAQKDMLAAAVGALITLALIAAVNTRRNRPVLLRG